MKDTWESEGSWEEDLAAAGVAPTRQRRSREMRDRLIGTSLEIARRIPFEQISVLDLCQATGCSTGAFYARFPDKNTLFRAVMVASAAQSGPLLEKLVREAPFDRILPILIEAQVRRFREHEDFYRAVLRVSLECSDAWTPFRRNGQRLGQVYLDRLRGEPHIDPARISEKHVRFAFQSMYAMLNSSVMNRPGPFDIDSPEFPRLMEESMSMMIGCLPESALPAARN
ncbi:TetR/AcrR family transcriptional regulator [Altericroceibacterium spongiae]|uniref:TetR/AcrR family transcriptional regulator n=1 Tax=Altericroceibacterium spongiae TaxID=2320269 RepID=A0A420EQR3_9SPHN|nr:TetR/AcrR family transcriptional regulator [Altericroceibacterium spongiae]RKF23012.1 TetR/AcrR family transcriptional regulator [Altericroceibacterium spongiae]